MGQAFNQMRWHAGAGQWYVRIDGVQRYLGAEEVAARGVWSSLRDEFVRRQPAPVEEDSRPVKSEPKKISGLVLRYIEVMKGRVTDRRTWSRINAAMEMLLKHFGKSSPAEFRAKSFRFLREQFVKCRREVDGMPVSRKWVNHLAAEVRAFVRWASEEELMPSEAAASVMLIKPLRIDQGGRETEIRMPPEAGAVEATLPYLFSPVREMVELQLLTGLRPGELCELKPAYFSRSPGEQIQIPNTRKKVSAMVVDGVLVWLYIPTHHKTLRKGKHRVIPMGPKAQVILAPFLDGRAPFAHVFDPRLSDRSRRLGGRVIKRDRMRTGSYWRAIRNAIRRANRQRPLDNPPRPLIPHWHPYQIRHAAATSIGDQYDSEHAAAILGHSGTDAVGIYMQQAVNKAAKVAAERG
jgi:integrase